VQSRAGFRNRRTVFDDFSPHPLLDWLSEGTEKVVQRLYDVESLGIRRLTPKSGIHGVLRDYDFERPALQLTKAKTYYPSGLVVDSGTYVRINGS
jgi:hypothetical protein